MANDVKNTSSKVYRLLSDRCSLRVESAANPLRCCLSWRRACEVRRGGPAGRVRGHRMTGGTPKEVHWTAEQQKRPQRTYRGRKRRETAAQGLDHWACFRPKMSCLSTPPKIRLSVRRNSISCRFWRNYGVKGPGKKVAELLVHLEVGRKPPSNVPIGRWGLEIWAAKVGGNSLAARHF